MKTTIGDFLFERKGKYKPSDKDIQGLSRIEKIDFSGNFHIGDKPSKTNMILVKRGDLVISGINVAKGAMGIYEGENDIVATIHYSSYTFDKEKINLGYFKHFLKSAEFIRLIQERIKGGIKTEIKPKHLLPLEINLPDLATQKKVVEKFESVETDIESLNNEVGNQQNLLKKLRQSILQEAIEGKLTADWRVRNPDVESASVLLEKIKTEKAQLIKDKKIRKQKPLPPINKDEIPFDIPDSWVWCRLGNAMHLITDGTHHTPTYTESGVHFLSVKDVAHGKINFSNTRYISADEHQGLTSRCNPKFGDLLLTKVGTTGIAKVVDTKKEFSLFVSVALLKFNQENICNYFLEHLINSPYVKKQSNNGTKGMGNKNLVIKTISNFLILLPYIEEQKQIVKKIDNLFKICDELETQINQSKTNSETLMQAVLKEAFSSATVE